MAATDLSTDPLVIAGETLGSRLLLGTGGFRSLEAMGAAIEASGTALVTVALRRVDPGQRGSIVDVLDRAGVRLLPNTAGCFTARDAVLTARLAREAFGTPWVKLEVEELRAGLRPATPDNLPVIGPAGLDGLVWATGHFRNGILLTPVTAELAAAALAGEPLPEWAACCDPRRFARVETAA